jgi:hypothetical protein
MAQERKHRDKNLKPDDNNVRQADQAEGERNNQTSAKVKGTPDQAEGDRDKVEENIRNKEKKGEL